jgi:capsular polysaccharide transport system permease protein
MNFQNKQRLNRFVEFYEGAISSFAPTAEAGLPKSLRLRRPPKFNLTPRFWFALVVILPTLLTGLYFAMFAADQYLSQAEFVVRTPESASTPSGLGALLGGSTSGSSLTMSTRSDDDTYIVQDYIMSRDMVSLLEQNDHLRDVLNRSEADFISKFPRFYSGDTFEDLYKAYARFVEVSYDSTSGLSTIKVNAFRPDDARQIASSMLTYSEQLVNRLNQRDEQNSLDLARREVEAAEHRLADVQIKVEDFRNRESMLDPTDKGKALFELVAKLGESAAIAKAQLLQLERTSPTSPQIGPLKDQIAALESQMEKEQAKIAGSASSMAPKVTQYEQLQLEKTFAGEDLEAAHQLLQASRLKAEQQHLYLETIVQPKAADYALYPRGATITLTVFGVSLLLYGLGWLLVAGAREHAH